MKDLTQEVIRGGGSGIMYWEPAWISSSLRDRWGTGSSWENNAFFDFSGNALPVFEYMTHRYTF
jgi:arabinogalactan endo-1,4-beta-galactosidase